MPESYPNHTSNFPILNLGTFARSELVFCEIFSLQPFATGYTTPPAASEQNPTTAPCSVQQHPSLAPLQHELGTVRTLLAAPWSITPCSSTSRLARQHPQAAPSTRIRSPACPLQSRVYSTHHSDSSTFKNHPQSAPAAATWAPPASLQTVHTTLTASNTLPPAPCSGIPTVSRCPLQSAHTTLTAARTASTCQLQSAPRMVYLPTVETFSG